MSNQPAKHTAEPTTRPTTGPEAADPSDQSSHAPEELPESLLSELPDDAADEMDNLLAAMADEAINELTGQPRQDRGEPDDEDPELNPEEAAAFAEDEDEALEPAPASTASADAYDDGEDDEADGLITTMPTDDELDALLRGDADPSVYGAAPADHDEEAEQVLNDAAAAVAAELDEEFGTTGDKFVPGRPADGTIIKNQEDPDDDDLVADVAMESRGQVNAAEPKSDLPPAPPTPLLTISPKPEKPAKAESNAAPLWLTPLVWLSKPLEKSPVWVRDTVAKVAVITILNAAAVLAYVLVVRG